MAHIFISYARKDGIEIARELANRLRALDHEVFLDIHGIPGGSEWEKQLIERANWCDVLLVLVTEASNQSKYVYDEFREAEKNKKLIIPIQVQSALLPPHIVHLNVLSFVNENYDGLLLKLEVAMRQTVVAKPNNRLRIALPIIFLLIAAILVIIFLLNNGSEKDDSTSAINDVHTPTLTPVSPTETNTTIPTPVFTSTPTLTRTPRPTDTLAPTHLPTSTLTEIPTEAILYENNFEDGFLTSLRINGDWMVIDDGTGNRVVRISAGGNPDIQLLPSTQWDNYAFEARFMIVSVSDGYGNIQFRVRDQFSSTCPSYSLTIESYNFSETPSRIILDRAARGCTTSEIFGEMSFEPKTEQNIWHTILIEVNDNVVSGTIDGVPQFRGFDDTLSFGDVAIHLFEFGEAWFDDIRVWSLD